MEHSTYLPRRFQSSRVLSCTALAAAILTGCGNSDTTEAGPADALTPALLTASVPEFNILSGSNKDQAYSAATDGQLVLVGEQTGGSPGTVRSQIVSHSGTLGAAYNTGRIGDNPMIAFDGTNYLMVWNDRNGFYVPCSPQPLCTPNTAINIFGTFLDATGAKVQSTFRVTTENVVIVLGGIAYGGGKYLVTYLSFDQPTQTSKIYGRFVSTAGVPGPRFLLSTANLAGQLNSVATDGTDFLVVWTAGDHFETVKARLVRSNGTVGPVQIINSSAEPSNQPVGVAYANGTYMVTWSDSIGLHESDVFGRRVTAAGQAQGSRITINTSPGMQVGGGVSAVGTNFFVTWIELNADPTLSVVRGRFFNSSGVALTIATKLFSADLVTGKIPITPAPLETSAGLFFMVNRASTGADPQSFEDLSDYDLHGAYKSLAP